MKYPPVQYHSYLQLDALLGAQKLRSTNLTIRHMMKCYSSLSNQTYELWFKQILYFTRLESVVSIFSQAQIPETQMGLAVHRLERIVSIQKYINGQIDVLETITIWIF